jgi:hypothetical protein
MNTGNPITLEHRVTREVYSVDGVRVTLDAHRGWQCDCTPSAQGLQCAHIERANVFKQMRGVKREDDTIELELNASELRALEHPAVAESTHFPQADDAGASKRVLHVSRWAAVVAVVAVSGVSSGVTYIAISRTPPASVSEGRASVLDVSPVPPSAPPNEIPVRFVNPFDATEVFELPPRTSESAAREAVGEFLMKRARDRLAASPHMQQQTDNTADARSVCAGPTCSTQLIRTASSLH